MKQKKMKPANMAGCQGNSRIQIPGTVFLLQVDEFNELRAKHVHAHAWNMADESMSAFHPRTTQLGGLPNISFVLQKPEPLGKLFCFLPRRCPVSLTILCLFSKKFRYRVQVCSLPQDGLHALSRNSKREGSLEISLSQCSYASNCWLHSQAS